jgi:hypothetical protein
MSLIELVIETIKYDLAYNNVEAIEELLGFVPEENLLGYLPEDVAEDFKKTLTN